jgi:glycosyltransferase involved in cell wall biosynthesis
MSAADQRPLRILHASEVTWGGVVTVVGHLTSEQVRSGHDVHLLTPEIHPDLDPGLARHPWSVVRGRPQTYPRAVRELRRAIARIRPDVIHLHSFFAGFLGRQPAGLSGTAGVPVVYHPHAWSDRLFTGPVLPRLVRVVERNAARRTTMLVGNVQDELDRGRELGIDLPGRTFGIALDLDHFRPPSDEERAAARSALGFAGDEVVAVVLARLSRQKGQDQLLTAWERERPDNVVLALVGPGEQEPLRALAPGQWGGSVRAYGETDDARSWLWAADVMVLPSRYEGGPLVVVEAMATGTPVVSTGVAGAAESLLEGAEPPAGAVVPLGDMAALIDALAERAADPALRRTEAAAGPARAGVRCAPATVAGRAETAYRDALDRFDRSRR